MIQLLELRWRQGDQLHTFTLDGDGTPHLDPPPTGVPPSARTGPAHRGKAWSEDDEAKLRASFCQAQPVTELAAALGQELGRSPGAVRARLVRLGLLTPEEAMLRYPVAPRA